MASTTTMPLLLPLSTDADAGLQYQACNDTTTIIAVLVASLFVNALLVFIVVKRRF